MLWVIADGGSTDSTVKLIQENEHECPFVKGFLIKDEHILPIERYGFTVRKGFDYAERICKEKGWAYDFLCLVDVDVIFPKDYFTALLNEFSNDPKLGLASGAFCDEHKNLVLKNKFNEPKGPILVFRKECYEDISGFPNVASPDTVSILKAKNRGWTVKEFPNIRAVHRREFASKKGLWRGYFMSGKTNYYLNYHPVNALLTSLYYLVFKSHRYIGLAYLLGYITSALSREQKISDPEVKNYFWLSFYRLTLKVLLKKAS